MTELALPELQIDQSPFAIEQPSVSTARRPGARFSVLAVSPFSPLPEDAGQRKRVHQMLAVLKDLGLSVTLLLHPFEGAWAWCYQEHIARQLRLQYDEVIVVPAPQMVGARPRYGEQHGLDEWWDELLGSYLGRLFEIRHFDILVVNNVWLSKALTLVPPRVARVIDMHDLFHLREQIYVTSGIVPEFFRITEKDELFGLNRADICVSISLPEALHLSGKLQRSKIVYLPYGPPPEAVAPAVKLDRQDYLHPGKVIFGFIGTSHTFNVAGVSALIEELCRLVSQNFAPVDLVFAGTICDQLDSFAGRIHMTRLGWIEDEDEFYDRVDFFIVPVFHGTGFKIKVADALERRMPALFSLHAAEGLSPDNKLVAADARVMARTMSDIAFLRPPLALYLDLIDKSRQKLSSQVEFGVNALISSLSQCLVECILDLRGLNGLRKVMALLSAVALARELKDYARVRIVVDVAESWLDPAARYLPPSVSVESAWASGDILGSALNRVWWRFGNDTESVEACGKAITDLRFADRFTAADLSGEVVVCPDQAGALDGLAGVSWCCLPYLTDSTRWDPAAQLIISAGAKQTEDDWPDAAPRGDETIIIVDSEHNLGNVPRLMARAGAEVRVVDLRCDVNTTGLIGKLNKTANRSDQTLRILDGCTGASPFRHLVLEMAMLCDVPFSTGAFGTFHQIAGAELQEWRARKATDDQSAFRTVARDFDAMRGTLRRF